MNDQISSQDRLALLCVLDPRRTWYSLDDKRVCVVCEQIITGRQIIIVHNADGEPEAHCPSEGCAGTPEAWCYYGIDCTADQGPASKTSEFSFL